MQSAGSLKRRDYEDDDVFAMDIDDYDIHQRDPASSGEYGGYDDSMRDDGEDLRQDQGQPHGDENVQPPAIGRSIRGSTAVSASSGASIHRASSSAPAASEVVHRPHASHPAQSKAAGKQPAAASTSGFKPPIAGPSPRGPLAMAAPADLPRRAASGPAGSSSSRRTSEAEAADRIKKPRRSNSASAPGTPMLTPLGTTPLLGPSMAPFHIGSSAMSVAGSTTQAGGSSRGGSKGSSPKFGPSPSPKLGPTSISLESDLQPQTMLRQHQFKSGRR